MTGSAAGGGDVARGRGAALEQAPALGAIAEALAAVAARFDDPVSAHALARARALLEQGLRGTSRRSFRPGHWTASALVVDPAGQHVALIWHPKLGRWLQPGGHFEPGERDPLAVAAREASEELGLELEDLRPLARSPIDLDVHEIPARGDEPAHQHFDLRYGFRATTVELRPGPGIARARWIGLGEPPPRPSDRSVERALARLARRLV